MLIPSPAAQDVAFLQTCGAMWQPYRGGDLKALPETLDVLPKAGLVDPKFFA
jgi:hypothetical protein